MEQINLEFIKEFSKSRSKKLGASEIAACINHPDKGESLAGYEQTAFRVWEEKTGRTTRDPAGFAAEMGNILEPAILKKWILDNDSPEAAKEFYKGYILCELDKEKDGYPNASSFQNTNYFHHTKAETDYAISHADLLDIKINEIIEAKSSNFWASRRKNDQYKGYDIELKGGQGIPLKNFFQLQFQAAIYSEAYGMKINSLHLALIFDTNQFCQWEIRPDYKIQERLLEIASYMKQCIDKDKPPKKLIMNYKDIKGMYPTLNEDYKIISGDELNLAIEASKQYNKASKQIKAWEEQQNESKNALSILLKDNKELKGIIDGSTKKIASWTVHKDSEKIISLGDLKKTDEEFINILREKDYIKPTKGKKFININYKE